MSSNPRPLAPNPSMIRDESKMLHRPTTTSNIGKNNIRRASTACQNCKLIKRKCDQQNPCSNCFKSQTKCSYDPTQDGRRRAARLRQFEDLESKRGVLETILEALRHSNDGEAQDLLHLIRSNTSLDIILQHATSGRQASLDLSPDGTCGGESNQSRRSVMSISTLCDYPIIVVPAIPWTSITNDDDFVSHLISLYFTWFHPGYPCVDKDLFIQDMTAGNQNCWNCSSLLVNSMLAVACYFSDHPHACQDYGDHSTRGQHFLKEALHQWNEQVIHPTVLTLQAGQPLAVALTLAGKDRLSTYCIQQMNHMSTDLIFKYLRNSKLSEDNPHVQTSLITATRSLYLLSVGYSLAFMIPYPETWSNPTIEETYERNVVETPFDWIPYPNRQPTIKINLSIIHDAYNGLHHLGMEITRFIFDKDGHMKGNRKEMAVSLEERLNTWYHELSSHARLGMETDFNPVTMDLHLVYHWIRMTLFNFLRISPPTSSTDQEESIFSQYARTQCLESAKQSTNLYTRISSLFGPKTLTIWMPQTAVSIAYTLLDDLSPSADPSLQETFHSACHVLNNASQKWLVMRAHIRMILLTAEEKGIQLPERTVRMLRPAAFDSWAEDDHKWFHGARYPNYALAKEDKDRDPRTAAMGELLEKWSHMSLDSSNTTTAAATAATATATGTNDTSALPLKPEESIVFSVTSLLNDE